MKDSSSNGDNIITDGCDIYIILDQRKNWITTASSGKQFHCHKGYFDFDEIIGKPFGSKVTTNKSATLYIYKPIPSDYLAKIPHSSQIIYSKDAGLILMNTGIMPGSMVIETGTGSGALTSILATYVKEQGHVFTYEVRDEAYITASKNIKRLGLESYVTIKNKDASLGFDEKDVDAVVLDLGDPCEVISHAYTSLKHSGTIAVFLPTYNQVERVYTSLKDNNFGEITAVELIKRELQLKPNAIRPNTRMIGHTGFLIFARKLSIEE